MRGSSDACQQFNDVPTPARPIKVVCLFGLSLALPSHWLFLVRSLTYRCAKEVQTVNKHTEARAKLADARILYAGGLLHSLTSK